MRRLVPPGPMSLVRTLKAGSSGRYIKMTPATKAIPWQYDTCQTQIPLIHQQIFCPLGSGQDMQFNNCCPLQPVQDVQESMVNGNCSPAS